MTVTFSFWQLAMFAGLIVLAAAIPLWLLSRLAGAVPPAVSVPGKKGGVGGLLLVTVGILVVEALASLWHFGRGLGEVIRIMLMDTSFIWPVLQTLIPDFVIMTRSGKKYYWEHAGLISNPNYLKRHMEKLELYASAGITMWNNLIVTYDDEDGNLDAGIIESIIKTLLVKD